MKATTFRILWKAMATKSNPLKNTSSAVTTGSLLWRILHFERGRSQEVDDRVVTEEPLEIKLEYGPVHGRHVMSLSVTMRTPGQDKDLVKGFLYTEGIIKHKEELHSVEHIEENIVKAVLDPDCHFTPGNVTRHFYASSSCGVCGKASIDMVRMQAPWILKPRLPKLKSEVLAGLPSLLHKAQDIFAETGGLHATGLFTPSGELLLSREDVGRHNAMDKLIGAAMGSYNLPLADYICVVSGRAGFELVQKAWMAGIPIFAAVGAPSSLAVELADQQNMTLVGFLRPESWNVYTCADRIILLE